MSDEKSTSDEKDLPQAAGKSSSTRSLSWAVAWVTAFLLIAYPLSIGPIAKVYGGWGHAPDIVYYVYGPLVSLCDASPPVHHAMEWYLKNVWRLP